MTATFTPSPTPRHPRAEPADRGRLSFSTTTIERIAAQAVSELDDVGGSTRRLLGLSVGGDAAQVSARVNDSTARLDVRMSVGYPASVRGTTADARAHLIHRVGELTGLSVPRVDITVTALRSDSSEGRRVR